MSGQLLVENADAPDELHLRVRLLFTDGDPELRFVDQRTFGGLSVAAGGAALPSSLEHIGRDPLDPEFDPERLRQQPAAQAHRGEARPARPDARQRHRQHLRRRGAVDRQDALGAADREHAAASRAQPARGGAAGAAAPRSRRAARRSTRCTSTSTASPATSTARCTFTDARVSRATAAARRSGARNSWAARRTGARKTNGSRVFRTTDRLGLPPHY